MWVALLVAGSLALTACGVDGLLADRPTGWVPARQPSSPSSADRSVTVLHFNVAGATENDGRVQVIDRIVERVAEERPDIVSLNEICGLQNQYLLQRLAPLGYQGNYARNKATAMSCGINWSGGVAIYMAGAEPHSGRDFSQYTGRRLGQSTACITGRGQHPIYACSTHLSPTAPDAAREVARLLRALPRAAGSAPLVIAGDFNLRPSHPAMDAMYATEPGDEGFYEVGMHGPWCGPPAGSGHRGGCTWPSADPAKKIDYIFVDSTHFTSRVEGVVRGPGSCTRKVGLLSTAIYACSDHRQLWGTAELRTEGDEGPAYEPGYRLLAEDGAY